MSANYLTTICAGEETKPTVTNLVAHCACCGAEWAVRGPADMQGCAFCGAPGGRSENSAIHIVSEAPDFAGLTPIPR